MLAALSNPDLWSKIKGFPLDAPGAARPFSRALQEAEEWSDADTARVIEEYRRFLYLAVVLDIPKAPPAPIDAAWRMHLTYTRAYWESFVPRVLPGPLHRDATVVADHTVQRAFHKAAKGAYRREFGTAPPRDIWVHPLRPDIGGLIAGFMIIGFLGAFLSFGLGWGTAWVMGLDFSGPVNSQLEKVFSALFVFFLALIFLSPVWAWLVTRLQSRLRTSKGSGRGRWSYGIGLSFGSDRS